MSHLPKILGLILGGLLLLGILSSTEACTDFTNYFRLIGQGGAFNSSVNHVQGVAAQGDWLYVADGMGFGTPVSYFYAMDVSNPALPSPRPTISLPGYARSVALADGHAIVAVGNEGLCSIDIADPANPVAVDTLDMGYGWNIIAENDTVFVAGGLEGFYIVDCVDPGAMQLVGQQSVSPYYCTGVARADTLVYLALWSYSDPGELRVLSISDPTAPYTVGSVSFGDDRPYHIDIEGDLAYVGDYQNKLHVVEIFDPAAPVILGTVDLPEGGMYVTALGNNRVAVSTYGLGIVDVSDPGTPEYLGRVSSDYGFNQLARNGNLLYAAGTGQGVCVYDCSHTDFPPFHATASSTGPDYVDVLGDHAYVTGMHYDGGFFYRFESYDLSNPAEPVLMGQVDLASYDHEPLALGDYAYVPSYDAGLQVIDLGDPDNPVLGSLITAATQACHVSLWNGYLLVADGTAGIKIFDLVDPANPALIGSAPVPGSYAKEIFGVGNFAYVAGGTEGLLIYNIGNPASPALVGDYHYTGHYNSIALNLPYVYCLVEGQPLSKIWVVNATSPTGPGLANLMYLPSGAARIRMKGGGLYVSDNYGGVFHLDPSGDPSWPSFDGAYSLPIRCKGFDTEGDYLYVASNDGGLLAMERGCSETPVALSHFELCASATSVEARWQADGGTNLDFRLTARSVHGTWQVPWRVLSPGEFQALDEHSLLTRGGDLLYSLFGSESSEDWQLLHSETLHMDGIGAAARLLPAHPNPFNPHTMLHFELASEQPIHLAVYDVGGRRIISLAEGVFAEGRHETAWDGRDEAGHEAASGVYFARLISADGMETQRLILAR